MKPASTYELVTTSNQPGYLSVLLDQWLVPPRPVAATAICCNSVKHTGWTTLGNAIATL